MNTHGVFVSESTRRSSWPRRIEAFTLSMLALLGLAVTSYASAQVLLPDMVQVSAGYMYTCGINATGAAFCWGQAGYGALGDGSGSDQAYPIAVKSIDAGATKIASGSYHTCAVVDGAVQCWGAGTSGELGDGNAQNSQVPVGVAGLDSGATDVAAATFSSCAVANGAVYCWGDNSSGQLGDGTDQASNTPVQVSGLSSGATAVAVGWTFACAIVDGGVKCWGDGSNGQLGSGDYTSSSVPVDVVGLSSGVEKISASGFTVCALVSSGAQCWGDGSNGELGDGVSSSSALPVAVSGLTSGVTDIAVGDAHVCAIGADSEVTCWGYNAEGELGNGTYLNSGVPVDVLFSYSGLSSITAGGAQTCLIYSGNVYCWGGNGSGQLGNGLPTPSASLPTNVAGLTGSITAISTGANNACAASTNGVWCWGDNRYGQLGDGTIIVRGSPTLQSPAVAASAISTRGDHTCSVVNGAALCWGANTSGQLGTGSTDPSTSPVAVNGLNSGVTAIAVGRRHSCAVVAGAAKCWGSNLQGALGNASVVGSSTVPVDVTGLQTGVTTIVAGDDFTCAIVAGAAKCWGSESYGQLGNGQAHPGAKASTPVDVTGLSSGVTGIAAGDTYACAIVNGTAECWGRNMGRLGNKSFTDSAVPVLVTGFSSGATAITAGIRGACAIVNSAVWCWGTTATPVPGWAANVSAIAEGDGYRCAVMLGKVSCFGNNAYGRLGTGGIPFTLTPGPVLGVDVMFRDGFQ